MFTIGILSPGAGFEEVIKGFKDGMTGEGYIEGEDIIYIDTGALEGADAIDRAISDMLSRKVDLIYSLSTPASMKLKKAVEGTDVPGVFGPVFDPVSSGIVESISRPGGQLTGVMVRGSTAKALDWFLAIAPGVRHIFVPFHVTDKAACQTLEDLKAAAPTFGVILTTADLKNEEELDEVLKKIPRDADALWLTCSHLLFTNAEKIVQAANAGKIPAASSTQSRVGSGVLVSYGESDPILGKQVSRIADKVLKGMSPRDIPVERAEYELVIDLRAARSLNIHVPDSILKQADQVIR